LRVRDRRVSAALNRSITARTQLKTVFAKTGTHRQSELAVLLARLSLIARR